MPANAGATKVLEKIVSRLGKSLTPTAAREVLSIRADDRARRRIRKLAEKSDRGSLTPEEHVEYLMLVEVGDLVALLQVKARQVLAVNARG